MGADMGVGAAWRYLLVSEAQIGAAKGSWAAFKANE